VDESLGGSAEGWLRAEAVEEESWWTVLPQVRGQDAASTSFPTPTGTGSVQPTSLTCGDVPKRVADQGF